MLDIYYDILAQKNRYDELANFGEDAFFENNQGIYTIIYQYDYPESPGRKQPPYAFGLTIDLMDDVTFDPKPGMFNLGFPALGVKFSGYQRKNLLRSQFNIMPLLDKHGAALAELQQERLPLRLYLRPLREVYATRENVEFEVVLKNVSKRHMVVKSLGQNTLYFLFNNQVWGTQPSLGAAAGGEDVILKAGQSLNLVFRGESFPKPQEFDIYCVYRMAIDDVNPFATTKVKVVEP